MLSQKQQRILDFIKRYAQGNYNTTPTIAEIGRQFQMRSPASVHQVLQILEQQGLISRIPHVARGIRLT